MGSNNYGVRIKDTVIAGNKVANWDFSKQHHALSVESNEKVLVPDLPSIEEVGDLVCGEGIRNRINDHFHGEVAVYDFGNGNFGLCLQDEHENHYFVPCQDNNS